jgi:hypothetical protein
MLRQCRDWPVGWATSIIRPIRSRHSSGATLVPGSMSDGRTNAPHGDAGSSAGARAVSCPDLLLGDALGPLLQYPEVGAAVLYLPLRALTAPRPAGDSRGTSSRVQSPTSLRTGPTGPSGGTGGHGGQPARALAAAVMLRWIQDRAPRLTPSGRYCFIAAAVFRLSRWGSDRCDERRAARRAGPIPGNLACLLLVQRLDWHDGAPVPVCGLVCVRRTSLPHEPAAGDRVAADRDARRHLRRGVSCRTHSRPSPSRSTCRCRS